MGEGKTKKELAREFSAGGVVFKKQGSNFLWLVAKSSPNEKFPGEFWRLPKGWLDDADGPIYPGPLATGKKKAKPEEIQAAAKREVREEGGVEAKILDKVETARYFTRTVQGPALKFVTFYLMEWVKDLPEGYGHETAEIAWLPLEEAKKKLSRERERLVLQKASDRLKSGIQENLV